MIQRLGERIDEEELHVVKQMDADQTEGEKIIPVLFEEMDGVWLNIYNKHKKDILGLIATFNAIHRIIL